jgi:hypothetical protein
LNNFYYTTAPTLHLLGIISPQEMNQNPSVPTNPFDITNYVVALTGDQINLLLTWSWLGVLDLEKPLSCDPQSEVDNVHITD